MPLFLQVVQDPDQVAGSPEGDEQNRRSLPEGRCHPLHLRRVRLSIFGDDAHQRLGRMGDGGGLGLGKRGMEEKEKIVRELLGGEQVGRGLQAIPEQRFEILPSCRFPVQKIR